MPLGKIVIEQVRADSWTAEIEAAGVTALACRIQATTWREMLKQVGQTYARLERRQAGEPGESSLIRRANNEPERAPPPATMALIRQSQEDAGLRADDQGRRKPKRAARAETHFANPPPAEVEVERTRPTRRSA